MINDFFQSEVDESIEQSPSTTNNLPSLDLNELLNDSFLQSFTNNSEFPGASIIYESFNEPSLDIYVPTNEPSLSIINEPLLPAINTTSSIISSIQISYIPQEPELGPRVTKRLCEIDFYDSD